MTKERPNRYERHLNKKAIEKKERAKGKKLHTEITLRNEMEKLGFEVPEESEQEYSGIIAGVHGRIIEVYFNEQIIEGKLKQGLPFQFTNQLVVGDRVIFKEDDGKAVIEGRLPRKTFLSRLRGDRDRLTFGSKEEHVIAANIDIGVIVASATNPEFHPRFVDRYLILCQNGGIKPVLCLSKADLTTDRPKTLDWYNKIGVPVIETSAFSGQGIDQLTRAIHGTIAVLVGNSGVGKSTLINAIIPNAGIETKTVSGKTGKGRHTTTSTELYKWDENSFIIDTPGVRSLGLGHLDQRNIREGFPEFEKFTNDCQFSDCTHSHEPACGVKNAVKNHEISKERYESYLRMIQE